MGKRIYKVLESDKELRLLHNHIKAYNLKAEKSEKIKPQHTKTAETLIKLALKKEVNFTNPLYLSDTELNGIGVTCGYFKDNGAAIASQLQIHPKSFDRHLKRLEKAAIAASYKVANNGKQIRAKGKYYETLFAINKQFFKL
ncbi:MAG: hypothetical protein CMO01_02970 [Thalassobius sp.]|nr:hypothetical protein [Thalassovita sp.]